MMHIKSKVTEQVEKTTDILCDICGKSCSKGDYGFERMSLKAHWGFMSDKDLEHWEADVCEECVDKHLAHLIKFRISNSITGHESKASK